MQPATSALESLGILPQRLEVVDAGDQRTVFLNGYAAARYGCDDKVAERFWSLSWLKWFRYLTARLPPRFRFTR